jgi:hypothetical protein
VLLELSVQEKEWTGLFLELGVQEKLWAGVFGFVCAIKEIGCIILRARCATEATDIFIFRTVKRRRYRLICFCSWICARTGLILELSVQQQWWAGAQATPKIRDISYRGFAQLYIVLLSDKMKLDWLISQGGGGKEECSSNSRLQNVSLISRLWIISTVLFLFF